MKGVATLDFRREVFSPPRGGLEVFFNPGRVAVVGATETEGSVGRAVMVNLLAGPWKDRVVPVNAKRSTVLGVKACPSLSLLDAPVDLAVLAVPAPAVPDVIAECASLGIKGAVVISAGFGETGEAGAALERKMMAAAAGRLRIIGPNCLGVMCPPTGFNATFAASSALPGRVAFLSQSGALLTGILDWSLHEKVGFSAFVSTGAMADVGWGDLIDHFAADPRTESILIYMESVGDARAFMSAAREAALTKPIIVLKPGRTPEAARAAASHTGAMAGSDDVLDAAFRRAGVLRVDTVADLFHMASTLSRQSLPKGPRLAVLTNAGGPGVLAADGAVRHGGRLATLAPETKKNLDSFLPAAWSRGNPVDVLGDAGPERYVRALEALRADPGIDGLLVVLTPQAMTDPTATARALIASGGGEKPVLASWMGGDSVAEGRRLLMGSSIPVFAYPDTAARVFSLMWRHRENLSALYETPAWVEESGIDPAAAAAVVDAVRSAGRTLLTEEESKQVLSAYGFPVAHARVAVDEASAVQAAEKIGYPVVVKIHSLTVTHKSEGGGVRLDLPDAAAVRAAVREMRASFPGFSGVTVQPMVRREGVELILGAVSDPQFGPVILFGAGGRLTEVYGDRALELPPLNTHLAGRLMEKTRIHKALLGVRGRPPCDVPALEKALVRFSRLLVELPGLQEIDVNPLLASPEGVIALDARILLRPPEAGAPPRPAVRPYPSSYACAVVLRGGDSVSLRPIRPEDEPLIAAFHGRLSGPTVASRFSPGLSLKERVSHERLSRVCFTDFDREMVMVAERVARPSDREILAVGRLSRDRGGSGAALSLVVADAWQGKGLGTVLTAALLDVARREGLSGVATAFSRENVAMAALCRRSGFAETSKGEGMVSAGIGF